MDDELTPLTDVLDRLPWFRDLTREHRATLLEEVAARIDDGSREEFTQLLADWAEIAHQDLKWARFELLRESGVLEPPRAA